ncbi:MAG: carboxylesterase family protein [Pseudomonadales bacterium]|nr:carboxylesterase family protein [Pseudomonadales bacterium]
MKKFLLVALAIVLILVAVPAVYYASLVSGSDDEEVPAIASQTATRTTTEGEVVGFIDRYDAHAWLGIPYAAPPVGDFRWRAPTPPSPHEAPLVATRAGSMCPQISMDGEGGAKRGALVGDEDCLYLNIWAPATARELVPQGEDRLPVMFWIHGGGNSIGSGAQSWYNGSLMAGEQKVVVVTINYRLGPLGWFRHPALGSSPEDASGNYGTLDIIAALRWVQDNISNFGGDPGNVTIYGESAGGVNVLSMMASPLAKGLFHRAIVESGGYSPYDRNVAENFTDESPPGAALSGKEVAATLLQRAGRANDRAAAKQLLDDDQAMASFLRRDVSVAALFSVYRGSSLGMLQSPAVFGDGYVLPAEGAAELFSDPARYNVVPLIIGTNRDEVKLFLALGSPYLRRVFGFPWGFSDKAAYERVARYGSALWKASAVDEIASTISSNSGAPVFAYRFDVDDLRDLLIIDLKEILGAAHAFEIPFVFGNFVSPFNLVHPESWRDERDLLSNTMMSYWAEFARHGDPGTGRLGEQPQWTAWTDAPGADRIMLFDYESDAGVRMSDLRLTEAGVKAEIAADPALTDEQYCGLWRDRDGIPDPTRCQ